MSKANFRKPPAKHLYLKKANDDLISHCTCDDAPITFPPQMDCPWCGCGWLFCCANCRKAFTFAIAVEMDETWEATAMRDLASRGPDFKPTKEDVAAWVEAMQVLCQDLEPGAEYVYLDGWFIPSDTEEIAIEGMHSEHEINCVPQVVALQDKSIIEEVLGNQEYWTANEIPQDEEHDDDHDDFEDDDEDEDDDEEDR